MNYTKSNINNQSPRLSQDDQFWPEGVGGGANNVDDNTNTIDNQEEVNSGHDTKGLRSAKDTPPI